MRKARIISWTISLIICFLFVLYSKGEFNDLISNLKARYEAKKQAKENEEKINVYTLDFLNDTVVDAMKKIKGKKPYTFVENMENANFVITDEISTDDGFEVLAYSPIVICVGRTKGKVQEYINDNYLSVEGKKIYNNKDDVITAYFDQIFKKVLEGKWEEIIYCPKMNTVKGKVFYQLLIINANGGQYPRDEETLKTCKEQADKFLNSNIVIQTDVADRLNRIKTVDDEIYILFENELANVSDGEFSVAYPAYNVLYKIYFKAEGEYEKELREVLDRAPLGSYTIKSALYNYGYRIDEGNYNEGLVSRSSYNLKEKISYVDIPLTE